MARQFEEPNYNREIEERQNELQNGYQSRDGRQNLPFDCRIHVENYRILNARFRNLPKPIVYTRSLCYKPHIFRVTRYRMEDLKSQFIRFFRHTMPDSELIIPSLTCHTALIFPKLGPKGMLEPRIYIDGYLKHQLKTQFAEENTRPFVYETPIHYQTAGWTKEKGYQKRLMQILPDNDTDGRRPVRQRDWIQKSFKNPKNWKTNLGQKNMFNMDIEFYDIYSITFVINFSYFKYK